MLEETGTVVGIEEEGRVRVATRRQRACGGCQGENSCGAGYFAGQAAPAHIIEARANGYRLSPGDEVVLAIEQRVIWTALLLLYVQPILLLALGGVLGQLAAGESGAVIGAIGGLAAGLLLARCGSSQQQQDKYLPIVIKRASS
ncbi:RseC/MucC-like positive regulator of sigma(E) [Fluviicoccus keumensis]|uniref:RseC/MucC-like positive regulator of sigma(E) n=1 Tax=Fluviicoccus keumensis TaxID=1435465 RepID=A0A4Q7Z9B3_9GAMM|nr:SoxR reducing system RseC family protein [Fluviicoccus keumensis]RZU47100.1 RseC/MucC-like positive regulator of sigma(E) [Fluviicoccus keumensis]